MEQQRQNIIVTSDVVVLTMVDNELMVMLIKRERAPFAGELALPGGYVHAFDDQNLDFTARRVLMEKAGVLNMHMEQLATFSGASRDPRGYSVSAAYLVLTPRYRLPNDAILVSPYRLPELPFRHHEIIEAAVLRLRSKAVYSTAPAAMLRQPFSMPELVSAYETVLGNRPNESAFRRKFAALGLLTETEKGRDSSGRMARLYVTAADDVQLSDRVFGAPS